MSSRYRKVGHGANVDESLFGERSSELAKSTRKVVTGPLPVTAQATVISQYELYKIKNESIIKTDAEILAEREAAEKIQMEKQKLARERKERMKRLEEIAVLKAKKSDEEIAKIAKDQAIREAAAIKVDGYSDVVKALTSMSCRATAFTMREKQLEEKHRREQAEQEYDRRMDIVMEVDRLRDLQRREEEEAEKRLKRISDRKVITEQMEQRQKMKVLAAEAREQENNSMRELMKKYATDDAIAAAKRKLEIERSRAEVIAANELQLRRKELAKEAAKKEIEDILIYQAERDAVLARREAEELALEQAKRERQAMLLAQQERAQNNAGKLDEVRARRAAEERERRARIKEKEDAARKKEEMAELLGARARQAADKKERLERSKHQLELEHMNTIEHMKKMGEREDEERRQKHENAFHHRDQVIVQIREKEVQRKENRTSKFAEGDKIRHEALREESKYCVIRDRMVEDLAQKGVNPRYLTEMRAVDVHKILHR